MPWNSSSLKDQKIAFLPAFRLMHTHTRTHTHTVCPFQQLTLASFTSLLQDYRYSSWTTSALILINGLSILTRDPAGEHDSGSKNPQLFQSLFICLYYNTPFQMASTSCGENLKPSASPSGTWKIDSSSRQSSTEHNNHYLTLQGRWVGGWGGGISSELIASFRIILRRAAHLWIPRLVWKTISRKWNWMTAKKRPGLILVSDARSEPQLWWRVEQGGVCHTGRFGGKSSKLYILSC